MKNLKEQAITLSNALLRCFELEPEVEQIWLKLIEDPNHKLKFYDLRYSNQLQYNIELAKKGSLEAYCGLQFLIDSYLKSISKRLRKLFTDVQPPLRKCFVSLSTERDSYHSREYLIEIVDERNKLDYNIRNLKDCFSRILDAAKDLKFQVFDENEGRYDWYYVLNLSQAEIYRYFQRVGLPKDFIESGS